ncbi:MAG: FtsW/RodA/SpoVE family cell cycle protein [Microgenomates group bacterium]
MKQWVIPSLLFVFGALSVVTLLSIAPEFAAKQLVFFLVSGAVFWALHRFSFKRFEEMSILGYGGLISSLILVLLVAGGTRNTSRWIQVGDLFSIQPSQFAIPIAGLAVAHFISQNSLRSPKSTLKLLLLLFLPAVLIMIAPDLGSTILFLATVGSLILFSDIPKKYIAGLVIGGMVVTVFSWFFVLQPYQKARITSFASPEDSSDGNYHVEQALIAVGSGELSGRGLGQGVQSYLRFLPERQTDFIFASLAEEYGFIGGVFVLSLYALLIGYILYTGATTSNLTAQLYCYCIATALLIQMGVNIGMNMGLVPVTGITLPLLSYGGSSILSILISLAIIQSIIKMQKPQVKLHLS